jgi:hypothetical protein
MRRTLAAGAVVAALGGTARLVGPGVEQSYDNAQQAQAAISKAGITIACRAERAFRDPLDARCAPPRHGHRPHVQSSSEELVP